MTDSDAPSAPAAPRPPATLGETLRAARLAHDLTLEQLSTELRIEVRQLSALEENRFEQIGVPVFVKGYLKQYGTRLGVDVRDLLAQYYKQTTLADVQVQPSRSIKLHDERQITSWVLAAIVLLLVVAGLAVWWWNGGSFDGLPLPRSSPAPASTSVAPPAAEPVAQPRPQPAEQMAPPPAAATDAAPAAAQADGQPSAAEPAGEPAGEFVAPSDEGAEDIVAPEE